MNTDVVSAHGTHQGGESSCDCEREDIASIHLVRYGMTYFSGERANADWQELESPEAKSGAWTRLVHVLQDRSF